MGIERPEINTQIDYTLDKPSIDDAMNALLIREDAVIAEANDFWKENLQITEMTHRNQDDCCNFISDQFPKLPNLNFLEKYAKI